MHHKYSLLLVSWMEMEKCVYVRLFETVAKVRKFILSVACFWSFEDEHLDGQISSRSITHYENLFI